MWSKIINTFKLKEDWQLLAINLSIPLYFTLDANNQFWSLIPFIESVKITFLAFIGMIFFFLVLSIFITVSKSSILLSSYSIWYFFFKTIQIKIAMVKPFSFLANLGFYLIFSFLFLALITIAVYFLKESNAKKTSKFINLLFAVFVLVEIGRAGMLIGDKKQDAAPVVKFNKAAPKKTPDIYLIVMDEYAGITSAKSNFEVDNKGFVEKLRAAGFFVANNPSSNYNSTLFSLASMLNLNYSNNFIAKDLKDISAFGKAAKEIENNNLMSFLVSKGYSIKNYSGFRIKSVPSDAFYFMAIENRLALEKTLGSVLRNEVFTRVSSNSLQRTLGTHIAKVDLYNQSVYKMTEKEFRMQSSKKPKFVYTHFFMPHEPFLFTAEGMPRKYADAFFDKRNGTYNNSYASYMIYTNKKILSLLQLLLSQKGDKLIFLISDHGERFTAKSVQATAYNNFFAVYDSQNNYQGFTDTFPLINTFRVVLNRYFNQQLPMLENKKLNVYTGKSELF